MDINDFDAALVAELSSRIRKDMRADAIRAEHRFEPPRPSRLAQAAVQGSALGRIVSDVLPYYDVLIDLARHSEHHPRMRPIVDMAMPAGPEGIPDWVNRHVYQSSEAVRYDAEVQARTELRCEALTLAYGLLDSCVGVVANEVSARFTETWSAVVALVAAMDAQSGTRVRTAADAVRTGCVDQWRDLWTILPAVDEIRGAQRALMSTIPDLDHRRCGNHVRDPEARLYFHHRLDAASPGWRDGEKLWWPEDPAERAVWCVRNDSGAWAPTLEELTEHLRIGGASTEYTAATPSIVHEEIDLSIDGQVYLGREDEPRRPVDEFGDQAAPPVVTAFSANVAPVAEVAVLDDDDD